MENSVHSAIIDENFTANFHLHCALSGVGMNIKFCAVALPTQFAGHATVTTLCSMHC